MIATLVRPGREALDGVHRAERVRDVARRDDLDVAGALDRLVEEVEAKLAWSSSGSIRKAAPVRWATYCQGT